MPRASIARSSAGRPPGAQRGGDADVPAERDRTGIVHPSLRGRPFLLLHLADERYPVRFKWNPADFARRCLVAPARPGVALWRNQPRRASVPGTVVDAVTDRWHGGRG
jgi:hypothetical protein